MERYNIFQLVHKGLRASLYKTALCLQQTDFTAADEKEEALNRVREVIMLFEGQVQKAKAFILPAVQEYEPVMASRFSDEHSKIIQLGNPLKKGITKSEAAKSILENLVSGRELSELFIQFMISHLNQMSKEETLINNIFWKYYSDNDIKQIWQRISQHTPPWIQEFYASWMMRGINNMEAVNWMKAVERIMPPIVFESLLQKAEKELPEERFQKVTSSLSEGKLVA
ncbi:MAG: hypothetical protein ACJ75F_15480 [Flavisolibacter sp.]|jgi:hypothetical protein